MRIPFLTLAGAAILWLAATGAPVFAEAVKTDHVEAELVAENSTFGSGENWLALRLKPEEGWHIYWRNPGDSGLATAVTWTLPAGVTVGELQWPYPHRSVIGDIVNYGYVEETLHLAALTIPENVPKDLPLTLHAKAKWLVCKDICIPGSAELSLTRPLATTAVRDEGWAGAFRAAREALPQPAPADWHFAFATSDGDFSLGLGGDSRISAAGAIEFFPYANDLVAHSAPQRVANDDKGGLRISQKLSDYFAKPPAQVGGVLVVHDGESVKAWDIRAQPGSVKPVPATAATSAPAPAADANAEPISLALALLLAFGGGLVLNLMPCVFPLLSIKAVSIIESRNKNRGRKLALGFAYTSGVVLSLVALAGLLLVLRGTGAAIGWGFQLQQPVFVAGLAYLFFMMGLSLSGVAEIGTRWMGVGQSLTDQSGARGAFFGGAVTVLVASPCTAPFMGAALGYALTQPAAVALLVFVFLGLGLALPLPLVAISPAVARLLPKPGPWMVTFKQAMAFPLYLTVVWLLWVLGGLTDRGGMALALTGLTLLAFALWLWNRGGGAARLLRVLALLLALALLATPQFHTRPAETSTATTAHEPWSAARVEALRAEKRTIFVNFTADWCITCKVNERVALQSSRVEKAFAEQQVVWLEGDWTRSDPAISKVLARFKRSGVPLYLVYAKGGEPKVLPQVLTPDTVIEAITSAAPAPP